MNRRTKILAILATAGAALAATPALAEPAPLVYEGQLSYLDAPVDSSADLRFRLFDSAEAGAQLGDTIELPATALTDGAFKATLDFGANASGWLEVSVRAPSGDGDYVTLSPRQRVEPGATSITDAQARAAALAAEARSNASLSISNRAPRDPLLDPQGAGLDPNPSAGGAGGFANPDDDHTFGPAGPFWQLTGSNIYYTGGNVSIGTTSAIRPLTVVTSTFDQAIRGINSSIGGYGVFGAALGAGGVNFGVFGISYSPDGSGVFGQANSGTGATFGVTGQSDSTTGTGVRGLATAVSGTPVAVRGINSGTAGWAGYFDGGEGAYIRGAGGINADSGDLRTADEASLIIEGSDAALELLSDDLQIIGSVINLKELLTNGTYVDHWSIGRQASGMGTSEFYISYENVGPNSTFSGIGIRIQTNGNTGIGRMATTNKLEVNGNASKTASGSWLANSDARIKTDVETVTDALDTLDRVRLVSFEYTDDYKADHDGIDERRYLNVIAQEFAQVFPEHVKGSGEYLPDGSEILQVDIHPLTIYSAAAVQELRTLVTDLESENDEQSSRIADLESRLELLESLILETP